MPPCSHAWPRSAAPFWIQVGPFALHAAFLFMPLALTGMDILFMAGKPHAAYVCALLTGVALFLQPDAS